MALDFVFSSPIQDRRTKSRVHTPLSKLPHQAEREDLEPQESLSHYTLGLWYYVSCPQRSRGSLVMKVTHS
ncbi:hypothetical protein TNCV_2226711 [Trichonephila clavipes]|nr:hypothetical protein TNCV_2226711 [Trichonephila clavipes]